MAGGSWYTAHVHNYLSAIQIYKKPKVARISPYLVDSKLWIFQTPVCLQLPLSSLTASSAPNFFDNSQVPQVIKCFTELTKNRLMECADVRSTCLNGISI